MHSPPPFLCPQRLKDKLGDRSNASSEVEYDNAWAAMVGPEGRGVRTIIDMVVHTRLDCCTGSASLMRFGAAQVGRPVRTHALVQQGRGARGADPARVPPRDRDCRQAIHHVTHRHAFGAALSDMPLMRSVVADLALESEAAVATVMRLSNGFDRR